MIINDGNDQGFKNAINRIRSTKFDIDPRRGNIPGLRRFLEDRREFLVRLLENPHLLEHAAFTCVLWAVFHLEEGLTARKDIETLGDTDIAHI